MVSINTDAVWALVAFATLYIFLELFKEKKLATLARLKRCKPATKYPHKDPLLGSDLYKLKMQSIKDGDTLSPDQERFRKYGKTYETIALGVRLLYTMDWRVMHAIGTTSFEDFGVSAMRYPASMPLLGSGIFTTDGAQWEHSRSIVKAIFTRAQVSDLTPFAKHVDNFISSLPRDGSTVDLQHRFKLLMLSSSMEFIFGDEAVPDPENPESSEGFQLTQAFDNSMRGIHKRWFLGRFRFLLGRQTKYRKECETVHKIVDRLVDKACTRKQAMLDSRDIATRKIVLLDELVKETDDKRYIRDQLLGVFFPARDTSAITLGNIFWFLARHPHAWAKLRTEVLAIDQPLTFEYLKSLKYMHCVVNETIRLILPASRLQRKAYNTTVLSFGGGHGGNAPLLVRKGTYIEYNLRALHRDKDYWGPDADEFRPERWCELQPAPHWEFIPFYGGRRMCPAQQMVLTEIAFVLVKMLQEFETLENRDEVDRYVEGFVFTMESKRGVQVGLKLAQGS